jgi:Uma2 family endonuclease
MATLLEAPLLSSPDDSSGDEYELDARSNGTLMTPEEFDAVEDYDREYRYELIHGVVIVNPIPGGGQNSPNDRLGHFFWQYVELHPQGGVIDETLPEQYVYLLNGTRRIADRLVWTGLGRAPDLRQDVPTIAIEFNSKRRRDRRRDYETKRDEYLSVGIREYWVIDRFRRTLTVFRRGEEIVLKETENYTTALLPGFELPLAKLLAFADRYPQ